MKKTEKFDASCSTMGHLDPRVRRTRKLLQDALSSLLREKPFSAITIQDIAERATVNRATFYAHFSDKEELLTSGLKNSLREALIRRFVTRPALTPENLVEIAQVVFEFMGSLHHNCPEHAPEDLLDKAGLQLQESLYESMDILLSERNVHTRLFPDCSKETVANVLSWSIYGSAYRWSRSANRAPAAQVCRELVSILLPSSK